ncbi:hypothetical protein PCANC_14561 [Puccinia coronata f. sp. avenae]|uniref:Uncharacterized protein n=1 Tax=Puccinia coronata f. sp. avenae TaxID=200324 RepID=A0A2N5TAH5_9BASI|nr:hypothetical protein PCASD_24558 [Puccinia coronata f. sp. avenae]PLW22505.1 hypothetical protein PCANC_28474 [Puccinia coronata f. sp. avenae]PLW28578.1 hypothetical protein PCASD_20656 [Puccinia coronata f. sp. avenae]PLW29612.1 hypothetical protein PCASD_20912 [Puccinia coronata f. sp. avenae]PLW38070.1 hypothetical protein PCANC_14561 [Puccinia coronata f. sp. avenae]
MFRARSSPAWTGIGSCRQAQPEATQVHVGDPCQPGTTSRPAEPPHPERGPERVVMRVAGLPRGLQRSAFAIGLLPSPSLRHLLPLAFTVEPVSFPFLSGPSLPPCCGEVENLTILGGLGLAPILLLAVTFSARGYLSTALRGIFLPLDQVRRVLTPSTNIRLARGLGQTSLRPAATAQCVTFSCWRTDSGQPEGATASRLVRRIPGSQALRRSSRTYLRPSRPLGSRDGCSVSHLQSKPSVKISTLSPETRILTT